MTRYSSWKPLRQSTWIFTPAVIALNFAIIEFLADEHPHRYPWYGISLDGVDL